MTLDVEAKRMQLLALVESGELSSPRLLELWRDLNVALADKQAAEQRAVDGDGFGEAFTNPDSDYARASARHAALYAAVAAEAELLLDGGEVGSARPQILSDEMVANFTAEERIAAEFALLVAERHQRRTDGKPVEHAGWERLGDGRLVFTIVTTLHSGAPVIHRNLIEGRKIRSIYNRSERNDWKSYDWRFDKAFRGYWFKRDDQGVVVTDKAWKDAWAALDEPF